MTVNPTTPDLLPRPWWRVLDDQGGVIVETNDETSAWEDAAHDPNAQRVQQLHERIDPTHNHDLVAEWREISPRPRNLELVTVEHVGDDGSVRWSNGWSFAGIPDDQRDAVTLGLEVLVETQQLTLVTGVATVTRNSSGVLIDQWLWHKTDNDLEQERTDMLERHRRERQERLDQHREDWTLREALLPHPLRRRLERFRANGGGHFDTDGWGYELVVCELAVLYAESGQADTPKVEQYARVHGASGNQHDYARALSRHLTDDITDQDLVANSVSALSPITGDADYSEAGR